MTLISHLDRRAASDCLERVNALNYTIMVPQFSWRENALWGQYWMTYDGGLSARHLIKILRRFTGAFRVAVEELHLAPASFNKPCNSCTHPS